ncbi:hypothetical protein ILYODFUR_037301 [Ilyodon furcidens]|uniref:Retropepsins domain-containing protein n=1 Tax=Ilyodon furcidens TaxID=33524 RepID=A0ABV0V9W9_9TELE
MLPAKVGENCLNFLVDTGATYSTITQQPPKPLLSTKTVSVMGFSGAAQTLCVTLPLPVQPVAEEYADIYWGLLTAPSSPSGIFSVYQLWKPWIQSLCP